MAASQTAYQTDVLIIGSGPAGYTAAIYAARAGLHPILVSGMQPGGQLTVSTEVENYPGFPTKIDGTWLMDQMRAQAENVGTQLINDTIVKIDLKNRPFVAVGDEGHTYTAKTVIIATGASAKWLGLPSETKFRGLGVSACATCDGFFYKGKNVAVIGGGNTAVEEAIYLSNICAHVTLIHRGDQLRAEKIMQDRLLKRPNVDFIWNSEVAEVLGTEEPLGMTGIRIRNVKTQAMTDKDLNGLFIAIGYAPNTKLFEGQLTLENGYIHTKPNSTQTEIPGVFAAGDVQDYVFRQAVTSAGSGCMAALEADRFLSAQEINH